ncbi:MAG: hypothetical protein WBW33_36225 [Bryobacteraceae bacterium]
MMGMVLLLAGSVGCPVMNAATAGGALGGEVQATMTRSEKNSGYTCQFTRAGSELTIEIGVLTTPDQFAHFAETACQGGRDTAPLKAIGNEAIACSLGTNHQIVEKAVGRVRNQTFVLRFTTTDEAANAKSIRSKNTALAELVAGNLF